MDLDIGKTANERAKDQGYAPAYGLSLRIDRDDEETFLPGKAIWILNRSGARRGYGLTCLGFPQPDQWCYDHPGIYDKIIRRWQSPQKL